MFQIYTAFPRGFCAGVDRAINLLKEVIEVYGTPVYVNHEIIHNKFIVNFFVKKGVIFEEDISKIPVGSLVVVSAHGVGPSYYASLKAHGLKWIDATCPLVTKVHLEALQFIKKGYKIIYIGKKDHQEAQGVYDEDKNHIIIVSNRDDVDGLNFTQDTQLALLTQTTLSIDDTKELSDYIKMKFPQIITPPAGDICYATTNRQNAVKKLSEIVDTVIVIGSKNSSNSAKLKLTAEKFGKKAFLIDDASELELSWLEGSSHIGVTSGASGPEELVQEVVRFLEKNGGVFREELRIIEENMNFPYNITNIKS